METKKRKFEDLVKVMATLRAEGGCPWDREQTHESIRSYCLEEAYEVVDAIDQGDHKALCEELGDLLLQVVFHAQMASEGKTFEIGDVVESIVSKLIRRHPHVFRKEEGHKAKDAAEVMEKWAQIKSAEGRKNLLDGIPKSLPALIRAARVSEKAASVGFDWSSAEDVWAKVGEELDELRQTTPSSDAYEEEFGDVLFSLVNLGRHQNVDAETALRKATLKFEQRFRHVEEYCRDKSIDTGKLSAAEWDNLWNQAKLHLRA